MNYFLIALGPCGLFASKQGVVAAWLARHEADSLPLAKVHETPFPGETLGVSGLQRLTALPSHWSVCQPACPIGGASAPAQDFPAKERGTGGARVAAG